MEVFLTVSKVPIITIKIHFKYQISITFISKISTIHVQQNNQHSIQITTLLELVLKIIYCHHHVTI